MSKLAIEKVIKDTVEGTKFLELNFNDGSWVCITSDFNVEYFDGYNVTVMPDLRTLFEIVPLVLEYINEEYGPMGGDDAA